MKKIVMLLCLIGIFNHEQVTGMYRSMLRCGGSSLMALSTAILYYYNSGFKVRQQEVNTLDKEVIVHFYQNNAHAQDFLYQRLKNEAAIGKINWFDRYFSAQIRHGGCVTPHITLSSQSPNTQCWFKYDCDDKSGQEVLSRYDCSTRLNHELFKKCVAQGISEGRIK